jgi:hypothetical protein
MGARKKMKPITDRDRENGKSGKRRNREDEVEW